jgi:outer membrane protein
VAILAVLSGSRADAETLEEALATTYNSNPTLLAARAELRATNEVIQQALSGWRPVVTVTGSVGYQANETKTSLGTTSSDSFPRSVELDVSQPIYTGGRVTAEVESADNTIRAQRATLLSVEQSVLLDAVTAYMDVVRDEAVLQLNDNNEKVLTRQLQATRDRFEVGELTRTDVAQAEARLERAKADRIGAAGTLSTSRATYQQVVGIAPGSLTEPPPPTNIPDAMEPVVDAAQTDSPDVQAAEFLEQTAQDDVRARIGDLLPQLSLVGRFGRFDDQSSSGTRTESVSILAQLTVPIYQAGAVHSGVRQAKKVVNQRRLEVDEVRRSAIQFAISAWEALASARAQKEAFTEEVRAARIALEGIIQEADVGERTVLDVLDTQQDRLDAEVSLVGAQRDEIVAAYSVMAAMGTLTAERLELPVDLYDLEDDYRKVRDRVLGIGLSID